MNKNKDDHEARGDPLRDLQEWSEEFNDNSVEEEASTTEAAGSLEPGIPEPLPVEYGKHNVYRHFPKDRNCEVCGRTKITRAPCRKRTSIQVPRAEHFGDLITADHTVFNEECESRNSHKYAVGVQDWAT